MDSVQPRSLNCRVRQAIFCDRRDGAIPLLVVAACYEPATNLRRVVCLRADKIRTFAGLFSSDTARRINDKTTRGSNGCNAAPRMASKVRPDKRAKHVRDYAQVRIY